MLEDDIKRIMKDSENTLIIFLIASFAYASSFIYSLAKFSALSIPHDLMENNWFVFGETLVFTSFILLFSYFVNLKWKSASRGFLFIVINSYIAALCVLLAKVISIPLYYEGNWNVILLTTVFAGFAGFSIILLPRIMEGKIKWMLILAGFLHIFVMVAWGFAAYADPGIFYKNIINKSSDNILSENAEKGYIVVGTYKDMLICKKYNRKSGKWDNYPDNLILHRADGVTYKFDDLRFCRKQKLLPVKAKNND